jgi:hypothetical protein
MEYTNNAKTRGNARNSRTDTKYNTANSRIFKKLGGKGMDTSEKKIIHSIIIAIQIQQATLAQAFWIRKK